MTKNISRKKTTLWRMFDLYLGAGISFIRGLLIIPLYLHFIDIKLYGAWLATGNILMWLTLFDPAVGGVALQKIASSYASKDFKNIKFIISSSIIISTLISIFVLVIGLSLSNHLLKIVVSSKQIDYENLYTAFNIGIIGTAITLFSFSLSGSILGLQRTKILSFIRNGTGLIGIMINVYLLFKGAKLIAISFSGLIAGLISTLGYMIFLFYIIKKEKIGIGFDLKFMKNYSKIFTFTFLSKISGTITRNVDLILVSRFVNLESVTILELSRRPLKFITGFVTSPSIAMLPTIAHLYGEKDFKKLKKIILDTTTIFIIIFMLITGGLILFNKSFVDLWVGGKFYIGNFLNLVVSLTFLSTIFSYVISNFTFSLGAIKENNIFEFFKNILQFATIYIAGSIWGLKGILIGALIVSIFSEFWFYPNLLAKRMNFTFDDIKTNLIRLFIISVLGFVVSLIIYQFTINNWTNFIGFGFLYVLVFLLIIHFTYPDYKKVLIKFFRK